MAGLGAALFSIALLLELRVRVRPCAFRLAHPAQCLARVLSCSGGPAACECRLHSCRHCDRHANVNVQRAPWPRPPTASCWRWAALASCGSCGCGGCCGPFANSAKMALGLMLTLGFTGMARSARRLGCGARRHRCAVCKIRRRSSCARPGLRSRAQRRADSRSRHRRAGHQIGDTRQRRYGFPDRLAHQELHRARRAQPA